MRRRQASSKTMLVIFAVAMIVTTMLLSILTQLRLRQSIEGRGALRVQLIELGKLFSMIKDAETGQRGFLITSDEQYLQPFDHAVRELPKQMQVITGIAFGEKGRAGGPDADLVTLSTLIDQKLEELREAITVARREGGTAAADLVRTGRGKKIMDDLRALLDERLAQLEAEMARMSEITNRDLRWGLYSVIGTSFASLVAGILSWGMLRDSEQKARREERLAAEKRRAEEADREKSTFLATMSHEIRTPMNAIMGFGELLEEEARTDKEKRYAQSIVRSGHSLLLIINDILDLSKIEAGMMDLHLESTDVREIAAFMQQLFANHAAKSNVEMRIEMQDDVPASLMLDGPRLRQILVNLVGNAMKFTQQGHVTLAFHGQRGGGVSSQYRLTIEVRDTGVGIPPDRVQGIFKPFVQARAQRDVEMRGTGLGLAIVKRLTELMGGSIAVESEVGKGSVFRIMLPEVEISARLPQASLQNEPQVDFNDLRPAHILVVDDNPTNRELVRGFFEKTHHRVSEAVDGKEAVDTITREKPDLVLMDIRMPVMDGRVALQELRRREGMDLMPVIAVTASSMASEEGALRESFNGYVRKPYTRAQLYAELSQFIPRHVVEEKKAEVVVAETPAPEDWRALIQVLRDLETHAWPQVRDGMVISEVRHFAGQLTDLAAQYTCAPLSEYSARLDTQAGSFALADLERSLAEFPNCIQRLEARLATT